MKNVILKSFLLCCFVIAYAPTWAQQAKPALEESTAESALLWKIEGKDLKQPSYLYGTIHLVTQEKFIITDETKQAFTEAEQVVMELKMDDPNLNMEMMKLAPMEGGQTVDQLLTEEQYKFLDEKVKKSVGVSVDMFKSWHPMLLTSFLFTDMLGGQPASYEGTFIEMAKKQEKEIFGLETVADQIGAFKAMGAKQQAAYLGDMLDDYEAAKSEFDMMETLYLDQQIQKLYDYTSGEFEPKAKDAFLDKRNQSWVEPINTFVAEKSTFIAVGAAHLAGDNGVINLLRKAGYTLTPVKGATK